MSNPVKITGLDNILRNLKRIDRQMNSKVIRPAINKGLKPIQSATKNNCKWKSIRRLISKKAYVNRKKEVKGKVFLRPDKSGRTIMIKGREVGFEVVGNILEFGSVKQNITPRPFMRPARDQAANTALAIIEKEIRERLKKL